MCSDLLFSETDSKPFETNLIVSDTNLMAICIWMVQLILVVYTPPNAQHIIRPKTMDIAQTSNCIVCCLSIYISTFLFISFVMYTRHYSRHQTANIYFYLYLVWHGGSLAFGDCNCQSQRVTWQHITFNRSQEWGQMLHQKDSVRGR